MSQETLAAKQDLIDKQAEAAKAAEVVAEVEHQEIAEAIAEVPITEPIAEDEDMELWEELRSELSAIKTQLSQLMDQQQNQLQAITNQVLQAITEAFATGAALQAQTPPSPSILPQSETPAAETPAPDESAAETPELAAVVVEKEAPKKRRRI